MTWLDVADARDFYEDRERVDLDPVHLDEASGPGAVVFPAEDDGWAERLARRRPVGEWT